jgi:hypothetical protein
MQRSTRHERVATDLQPDGPFVAVYRRLGPLGPDPAIAGPLVVLLNGARRHKADYRSLESTTTGRVWPRSLNQATSSATMSRRSW